MPQKDMTVGSVTLWLAGYNNDIDGITPSVRLSADYSYPYLTPEKHLPLDAVVGGCLAQNLNTPAPNDGSLEKFTFEFNPVTLSANMDYWLEVFPVRKNNTYYGFGGLGFDWGTGGEPTGDAVYGGAIPLNFSPTLQSNPIGFGDSSWQSPAFSLNAVPEPSSVTLFAFLFFGGAVFRFVTGRGRKAPCLPSGPQNPCRVPGGAPERSGHP